MMRAVIELIFSVVVIIVARAILGSVLRGLVNFSGTGQDGAKPASPQSPPEPAGAPGRELHKDPVCGTYVAESTPYQRRSGVRTFYYCSEDCRGKHALAVH